MNTLKNIFLCMLVSLIILGGGELYLLTKAPGVGAIGNSGAVYKVVSADQ